MPEAGSKDPADFTGSAGSPGSTGAIPPTVEDALALGLTRAEYALICEHQGGPPNRLELAMYSLLWSEHCAYKHSRKLLRTLPTEGPHVVMGPGENAGAVDVGGGLVCAFKVESHNHPSAVEPFQGAATGVGGILRDIFAVGARPIAVLDSLRFGEPGDIGGAGAPAEVQAPVDAGGPADRGPADPRTGARAGARARYLLDGAVSGIGHYGNSIGVPTVGGEVYFEGPYEHNCLVNAMALGLASRERLVRSAAAGPGNVVILFGASTGRDGIGGASVLASAELGGDGGGDDEDKRPTVQVGDPFEEKKLLECSLELLDRGLLVSLQDLGAAGLTSSASEMASKGGLGIDVDISRVPLREPGMAPFEIMVSESQERMLCVAEPAHVQEVLALCAKWEVGGAVIGTVTDSGRMRVFDGELPVGDMPVRALVDDCPLYDLAPAKPSTPLYPPPASVLAPDATPRQALLALLRCPNIASRRPLFEQYDSIVQSRTVRRPEQADAAVLAIRSGEADVRVAGGEPGRGTGALAARGGADRGTGALVAGGGADRKRATVAGPVPALAVSIDCNGRRVAADPCRGTIEAVLECASNLACVGAEPLGTTNNLNFGNPEKAHVAWQLTESVRGLGEACRALAAPIVGGNVSLYNETPAGPIYPTPVIGMVGRLPDARLAGRLGFARAGEEIALVGPFAPSLAASELAKLRGEPLPDGLPAIDIDAVRLAQAAVREAVRSGALASAHDVAEGGLAVALAECCLAGSVGAEVRLDAPFGDAALFEALFGEGPGGFVVSGAERALRELAETGAPLRLIGVVGGDSLRLDLGGGETLAVTLAELADAHGALRELFA
ncbi:MAG TPA: phosphoribosylformylglycinamidine synthase subunit PurL [Solirubrobacteraceae bacterium]|nr:phosphoribosylformylglycinamidine synthase subunit PurL [Solirubrobacteraceae bacterium]